MKNIMIKTALCLLVFGGSVHAMKGDALHTRLVNRAQWKYEDRVLNFRDDTTNKAISLKEDEAGKLIVGYKTMGKWKRDKYVPEDLEWVPFPYNYVLTRFPSVWFDTLKEYVETGKNKEAFLNFVEAFRQVKHAGIKSVLECDDIYQ